MVKVQPVSTPPSTSAASVSVPPMTYKYQLSRLIFGKGQVLRAEHDGDKEVAQRCRHGRHQEEEDHDDAVHGEELVVRVRGDQIRLRREQLQPG